jgi:hypothetical protein
MVRLVCIARIECRNWCSPRAVADRKAVGTARILTTGAIRENWRRERLVQHWAWQASGLYRRGVVGPRMTELYTDPERYAE